MGTSGEHESWARPYVNAAGGHAEPGEAAGAYGEATAAYGEAAAAYGQPTAAYGQPAGHAQPAAYAQPAPTQPVPEPRVALHEGAAAPGAYMRASTEPTGHAGEVTLAELLNGMLEAGASDLHLTAGTPALIRVHGDLTPLRDCPPLPPDLIQRLLYTVLTQKQRERFEAELELDFAYAVPGARPLPRERVPPARDRRRGLPPHPVRDQDARGPGRPAGASRPSPACPRGMVLVTGPTGSGKSTTLAALIDLANRTRRDHIMTVEDPIEFLHRHKSCLVNQREVGEDTHSFPNALKHVLRQDPDIILVGEMRDLETISVALTAAETGHLVFATLHTQDAAQTIDRVIDVFPPHQQQQVRAQLAGALQGVVCQTLAQTADGRGPRRRHRGHGDHARHPQPHPRGQDPPDLLRDAGRRAARHAHPRPAPGRAGPFPAGSPTSTASRSATTSRTSTGSAAGPEGGRHDDGDEDVRVLRPRPAGKFVGGKLEAPTEAAVVQKLVAMGFAPVDHARGEQGMRRSSRCRGGNRSRSRTWR